MGIVSGSGQYHYGEEAVLSASPKEHCRFIYWSDGNTDNPRIVHVIADASYQAVFGPEMFTVTLTPNNPSQGIVYGAGEYAYGEEAVITAVPFPESHFRMWSDGDIDNPRTIVVTRNITLQALFGSDLGIADADQDLFTVTTVGRTIHLSGVEGRAVTIYDLYGRQIYYIPPSVDECTVHLPAAGVYLVCPEGGKATKVVVL